MQHLTYWYLSFSLLNFLGVEDISTLSILLRVPAGIELR
jgi:hypothetical protein